MKKLNFLIIIALTVVIGFTLTACSSGGGGNAPKPNTDPKTIVISGLADSYMYGSIALFTAGTSLVELQSAPEYNL